jgi:hypothetical protein
VSAGSAGTASTTTSTGSTGNAAGRAGGTAADTALRMTLQSIEFNLDPLRVTSQSASQALSDITRVLPMLRTRADSMMVEVQRIEAHIALNQPAQACGYIRLLLPRADTTYLRALRSYSTNLKC